MKIIFPRRIRFEAVVLAALMLGSCEYHTPRATWEKAETAEENARHAIYQVSQLESRVEDIESRLNM